MDNHDIKSCIGSIITNKEEMLHKRMGISCIQLSQKMQSTNEQMNYLVSYIIHYNCSLGTTVVHRSQTVVPLLSGRVPNFKFDDRVIQTNGLS